MRIVIAYLGTKTWNYFSDFFKKFLVAFLRIDCFKEVSKTLGKFSKNRKIANLKRCFIKRFQFSSLYFLYFRWQFEASL